MCDSGVESMKNLSEKKVHILKHLPHHLGDSGDHERLWQLLRNDVYRKNQIAILGDYQAAYEALNVGLNAYVNRNGKDDARLCWIALRAGRIGNESKVSVLETLDWESQDFVANLNETTSALTRIA